MPRPIPLVALAALALVAVTGCLSPWLKRAADAPDPKPSPALVAGLVVRFDSGMQEKTLLDAAIDAAQNAQLEEFGKRATEMLGATLEKHGYTTTFDGARSSQLDAIQISSSAATAALTGQWRHPDSSYWVPQTVESLFVKPADIIGKIRVDGQKEFFAFADVTIRDSGMLFKEPYVVVRTSVFDQDARKVLDLGGIGSGSSTLFIADRSPSNLQAALQQAFASLESVKEEQL